MPRKGQCLSESAIEQMKRSKQIKISSKYHWEPVEPYLDIIIDNGSRNRKVKFITLREFKYFIESGKSLRDIKKEKISRHLIGFFSNLCQGKIQLLKEKFLEEYESGLSLEQIAQKYNIIFGDITFLRQLYECKAKGPTFQERKRTEIPLTQRQLQILYGTMMGDGKKASPSAASFKHSIKQKPYLMWKYKEMENVSHAYSLQRTYGHDDRYNTINFGYRFYTKANTDMEYCNKLFYPSLKGFKKPDVKVLDYLSELSIAIWYMDDGRTGWGKYIDCPELTICTDSFSKEFLDTVLSWFKNKWKIIAHLRRRKKLLSTGEISYRIIIDSVSRDRFFEIIKSYIVPCMMYKVDHNAYLEWKKKKEIIKNLIIKATKEEFLQWEKDGTLEKILDEQEVEYNKLLL